MKQSVHGGYGKEAQHQQQREEMEEEGGERKAESGDRFSGSPTRQQRRGSVFTHSSCLSRSHSFPSVTQAQEANESHGQLTFPFFPPVPSSGTSVELDLSALIRKVF